VGETDRQALALLTELGMRPLVAHYHFALARLDRRLGRQEKAQTHFTTAMTLYREMDMQFWMGASPELTHPEDSDHG